MTDAIVKRKGKRSISAICYTANGTEIIPGEGDQLIDLDANYSTSGASIQDVIDGIEQFYDKRLLSKELAETVGVQGTEYYDPMPSRRNAVLGGESFITAVKDGFIRFIKFIIDFIAKCGNWIKERIKVITGFQKTSARIKAAESIREDLEKELKKTFAGLGVPTSCYSIDRLVESAPNAVSRLAMIKYLQTGMKSEEEMVAALCATLPLLSKLNAELAKSSSKIVQVKKKLTRHINMLKSKMQQNKVTDNEVVELLALLQEVKVSGLQYDNILVLLNDVTKVFYSLDLDKSKLAQGFMGVRQQLDELRKATQSRMNTEVINALYRDIATLNNIVANTQASAFDFTWVDADELKTTVNLKEAEFIKALGDKIGDVNVVQQYQQMSNVVKDFSNVIDIAAKMATDVGREIDNYQLWKARADGLLAAYATNDIEIIKKVLKEYIDNGVLDVNSLSKMVLVPQEYGNKIVEGSAELIQGVLDANLNGIKDTLNTFARQIGLNLRII